MESWNEKEFEGATWSGSVRAAAPDERADRNPEVDPGIGAETLDDVVAFVRRFVVVNPSQADAIALWVAHSHAIEAADCTPYLAITSAEKRSGKTRTFDVVELLVRNPWRAITPTEAVVYRKIEADQPTLLLDEVDAIFGESREHEGLRALLNAGNRRGTTVPRCVGPAMSLTNFSVFGAKALAGIGRLPDTVADRAVLIRVKRKAPDEDVQRFRRREVEEEAGTLRDRLAAWVAPHLDRLRADYPELPTELDDRAQDAWEPLLAIADLASGDWPHRARTAAVQLSEQEPDDVSLGVRLLADIHRVFTTKAVDRLATAGLIEGLCADEEAPWGHWKDGGQITPRRLASILKRYEIHSRSIRLEDGTTPKGFLREQFEDAWRRYPPSDPPSIRNSATTSMAEPETPEITPPHAEVVADTKSGANPHGSGDVAAWRIRAAELEAAVRIERLRRLPNDVVRRALDAHRPELVGADEITTADERRMVAALLLHQGRT
jgi:hypothetical protein